MNLDGGIHEIPLPAVSGRLWLCGKHFIAPRVEHVMRDLPADGVVCLVEEHELRGHYEDYMHWLKTSGRARWFPIHDLSSPDFDEVLAFYEVVAADLGRGQRLVVHCAAGRGRAGTLAVAVCQILGMPLATAMDHVRAHRLGAGPEAGAQADVVRRLDRLLGT